MFVGPVIQLASDININDTQNYFIGNFNHPRNRTFPDYYFNFKKPHFEDKIICEQIFKRPDCEQKFYTTKLVESDNRQLNNFNKFNVISLTTLPSDVEEIFIFETPLFTAPEAIFCVGGLFGVWMGMALSDIFNSIARKLSTCTCTF